MMELILVLAVFIITKYMTYKTTEEWGLPRFLDYRPYSCQRCLTFWTLTSIYLTCGLILHLWITMAVGLVLTILDTIAFSIHIKENTVSVNDMIIIEKNTNKYEIN